MADRAGDMKRDMDLVRTLLLKLESLPMAAGDAVGLDWTDEFFDLPGFTRDDAIRHFDLLMEAGFIANPGAQGMTQFVTTGMTWQGHELLDSIRSPEVWSRTKAAAKSAGGVGLDLLLAVAKAEGKRLLTEKLGLPL